MGVCDKIGVDEALAVIAERLMVVPLDKTAARRFQNCLRLNFSKPTHAEIRKGIAALKECVTEYLG